MEILKDMKEKIKPEWWSYDGEFHLTESAPRWLKQEMKRYNQLYEKWHKEGEKYIIYDVPFDLPHPILNRLTEEQLELFELELEINKLDEES